MKVKALIPARSGSQRVKNKNIRKFASSSLLEIKINQLKRIKNIDGIIVNSNDDTILEIAKDLGCETVKRDDYFASNTVSMSDVYVNMAQNFDGDVIVYTNATNPLLKDSTIEKAIETFKSFNGKYDSLNTAHLIKEFLFKDGRPINYDLKKMPRSQDLPDIYAINFAVSVITKENMIKMRNVVGSKPYIYGIDEVEATDIDNPIDFEFAEYIYKKYI